LLRDIDCIESPLLDMPMTKEQASLMNVSLIDVIMI